LECDEKVVVVERYFTGDSQQREWQESGKAVVCITPYFRKCPKNHPMIAPMSALIVAVTA
jgi:hypothetical protein